MTYLDHRYDGIGHNVSNLRWGEWGSWGYMYDSVFHT